MPLAQISEPVAPTWVVALLLLAVVAALAFWGAMLTRRLAGRPILPREPRRGVPWQAIDLLVVLVAYLVLSAIALEVVRWSLGLERVQPAYSYNVEAPEGGHAVLKVLATGDPWVLLLCVVAVVVVAPVAEEFVFRLLLQGWLETCVDRWSPRLPNLLRLLPGASGPILFSSLLFARAHFRVAGPSYPADVLVAMLLANAVASSLLLGFAVVWLRQRSGATAADLGFVPARLGGDVRLGLWSLVGLLGPIYTIQFASHLVLPKHVAPDPIPLFFLAIGLGLLYARTHRLVPCIVLHAALNAASLALAFVTLD